ncbi:MAG: restriction endonuclease subunit S [Planctomycetota bacterium]
MSVVNEQDWPLVSLDEVGEVNRGRSRHRPRYAEHLYGGPYPFIQTGDIKQSGGRITEYEQTYSEAGLAQSRLWPEGAMCITIEANIAETAILTFPACFPDSVVGFIADESKCDVRFIEYTFRNLKRRIQHEATGSVQDNINLGTLQRLKFQLPPLREQRAIASILGALDDKIELNRRMNATLESLARAIFKSWFVDFDPVKINAGQLPASSQALATHDPKVLDLFPSTFQDSELGPIPEGWSVGRLDDLLVLQRGFDLPKKKRVEGKYPVCAAGGHHGSHNEFKVNGPGVVTGRSGVLGNVYYVHEDHWPLNTTLWVKEFKASRPIHAFHHLQGVGLKGFNAGSAVPTLNRNHVHGLPSIVPPDVVVEAFEEYVQPLFDQHKHKHNTRESDSISNFRDTLLPQLLSGDLPVPHA